MSGNGAPRTRRKPLLCRLGWHTSTFLDGALCFGSTRCNRCLEWLIPEKGARVDSCRRYVDEHGMHAPLDCRATSRRGDEAVRDA